jgi:hypothetical protein
MRVLGNYFETAGPVTIENAWEHVYRCLLWMNASAGLVHIYDSNHMQRGGGFHSRAVRFTDALCKHWGIPRSEVRDHIDILFKGCVEAWRQQQTDIRQDEDDEGAGDMDQLDDSELFTVIAKFLEEAGLSGNQVPVLTAQIENAARDYFTIGKKRSNALGEGFEDLLSLLIRQASGIPVERIKLRTPVSKLPGFRKPIPPPPGAKKKREPTPDLAIVKNNITHVITTAKWSMRQDRQQQFAFEYNDFQLNKEQPTELTYSLITNEFDLARLKNVADAIPSGRGGYIFHIIYHINLHLLRLVHGDNLREVGHHIGTNKIRSLSDFLRETKEQFGDASA